MSTIYEDDGAVAAAPSIATSEDAVPWEASEDPGDDVALLRRRVPHKLN